MPTLAGGGAASSRWVPATRIGAPGSQVQSQPLQVNLAVNTLQDVSLPLSLFPMYEQET